MTSFPPAPAFAAPRGEDVPGLSASASAAIAARGTPATLNLDDIFGDVLFTPDGDTVFLNDQPESVRSEILGSGEAVISNHASRQDGKKFVPVAMATGIAGTQLDKPGMPSTVMIGTATSPAAQVGFKQPPQQRHHLQYASAPVMKKRSRRSGGSSSSSERKMSEQQKVERRYVCVCVCVCVYICVYICVCVSVLLFIINNNNNNKTRSFFSFTQCRLVIYTHIPRII